MKTKEYLIIRAREGTWIPTYTPNGMPDGSMCFDAGKTYHLKAGDNGYLDVSDYCMDELVVLTRDIYAATIARCFEVLTSEEAARG